MRRLADALRDGLQTALRLLPWPTEPGLRAVGRPDEWSPVLVTCNYDLTVRRVLRALEGVDAWLVVAPTRGINVWCAASGGHMGTHQVVTALKTSGVADRVSHRRALLPQLSATGVEPREVQRRCGWRTRFGPVHARDLPRYLASGEKDDDMRRVRFGARERLEMAASWGIPGGLLFGAVAWAIDPAWAPGAGALALGASVALFAGYDRLPEPRRGVFGGLVVAAALALVAAAGGGLAALAAGAACGAALTAVLTYDYSGSTPIEGGSHFEERRWKVVLDRERCRGVWTCWQVCPEACFEKPDPASPDRRIVVAHEERCVRCGACIVQCPMDALAFEDDAGDRIDPDVIRRFKLNLLGRRSVASSPGSGS